MMVMIMVVEDVACDGDLSKSTAMRRGNVDVDPGWSVPFVRRVEFQARTQNNFPFNCLNKSRGEN